MALAVEEEDVSLLFSRREQLTQVSASWALILGPRSALPAPGLCAREVTQEQEAPSQAEGWERRAKTLVGFVECPPPLIFSSSLFSSDFTPSIINHRSAPNPSNLLGDQPHRRRHVSRRHIREKAARESRRAGLGGDGLAAQGRPLPISCESDTQGTATGKAHQEAAEQKVIQLKKKPQK